VFSNYASKTQNKFKIFSKYFYFSEKGLLLWNKTNEMVEKKAGRGLSGRPPLFNEVAPNGYAACSLVIRVSREDYARWNDYKARLAAETPGVIPTNDEAFTRLIGETMKV